MSAHTQTVALDRIGQIHINIRDLDRAVSFYRDTLGMKFLFQVPNMAFFDCGGVRLMLSPPEDEQFDHKASILYYLVPDIQAAVTELKASGVVFESEPRLIARMPDHDLWMVFLRDSEGNPLELMSEVRRG